MGFDPARRRAGGVVVASLALIVAGTLADEALRHGFWGTLAVAGLIALWLVAVIVRTTVHRPSPYGPVAEDDGPDDESVLLRVLLDRAPGALLAVEPCGRVRAINRAARLLFATDDRVIAPPAALFSDQGSRLQQGGRNWRIDRAVVGSFGVSRTVAALVDVEAEEHAAEARATRDLLRVLGHEVMNALAPIASLAESAQSLLDMPERRDRLLPEILGTLARRAEGLRRFTDVYRQVARLPAPVLAPVRLDALMADLGRIFETEWAGVAVLETSDPGAAVASLDRDQVVQALLALLRNAAEAGAASGAPTEVRLLVHLDPDRVTFHVVDQGPGVDPASAASIFLPFFTTRHEGSGIGLAAARQVAQGHGGHVVLRPGRPTTFELSLPR